VNAGRPAHHAASGFRVPWPIEGGSVRGFAELLRWRRERRRDGIPPDPPAGAFPVETPDVAYPRAPESELRITWVGHATTLIQIGGLNILTDPIWSERASPLGFMGPARITPPGLSFDRLPPIDAVLISHDHYDHLDSPTVRRIVRAHGDGVHWIAPLGYHRWLERRGARVVYELDWEQDMVVPGHAPLTVMALPAQHWTRRSPFSTNGRLWASFLLRTIDRSVYFGGDSGYFDGYSGIGARHGPFDAALLPIGAYEPRWFMRPAHMNPAEAVRAYLGLGGTGTFVGIHWGTFRLTDESPLDPPSLAREAWESAGLPGEDLWIPSLGGTRVVSRGR
jgi:N-acyl-phosphatidylethanolamine-hydrolysing phospholipase D